MEKLTIIILTFNEEDNIEEAISTANFADEIIVIDSFSTDKTAEFAQKYNVNFIQNKFEDFTKQRYEAAKQARNNMILFLDADERIPILLKDEIQRELALDNQKSAYKILFSHIFMGKAMKNGFFRKKRKLRLFNKNLCWYDETLLVHEKLLVKKGEIGKLTNPIIHHTYRSLKHTIMKKQFYSELQAKQLYKQKVKPNFFHFVIKPSYRFVNQYFFRGGFLYGYQGFFSAFINSCYVMNRYIKLWLMNNNMA